MESRGNVKTKYKRDIGYKIFYIAGFAILFVIGFFGNSFFAYEIFNSIFFNVLSVVLTVSMLFIRSIQIFLRQATQYGKIFVLVFYNLFALAVAFRRFVPDRTWTIILFFSVIVAIILLITQAFKYIKAPNEICITKYEPIIAMLPVLLLLLLALKQSYTSAQGMWIPVVIGGTILAALTLFVFLKFFKDIDYFVKSRSELIMACILLVILCFILSFMSVSAINYAFDSSSTTVSAQVLDKNVQSGARQVTSFYLEVKIDETEIKIRVPVEIYHSAEVGDNVEIKLYNGAFGYSYYIYEYTAIG